MSAVLQLVSMVGISQLKIGKTTSLKLMHVCLFRRKPQARKNKTWEEDGILVVNGDRAVLKAQETAKMCLFPFSFLILARITF